MIISRSFFKGIIHIQNAQKKAPNSSLLGAGNELDLFIEEFERDVLTKCLGYPLFSSFETELDADQPNGLKDTADDKWDDLLNGKEYTISGTPVIWKGLKFKEGSLERSLIAYYVFYQHLDNDQSSTTQVQVKNAIAVSPVPKAVKSWRKFYELTVGAFGNPTTFGDSYGSCVDWLGDNGVRSLYQFIQDMNNIDKNTYQNWKPKAWLNKNQFGL